MVLFDEVLADHQAHADSLMVHIGCTKEFAELGEQLAHLILHDALTSVDNVHLQLLIIIVISGYDSYLATTGELVGVLHQIDQDLLDAHRFTYDSLWQLLRLQALFVKTIGNGKVSGFDSNWLE